MPAPGNRVLESHWEPRLRELTQRLAAKVGRVLIEARTEVERTALARPAATGVGDVTFGLDLPGESVSSAWLEEQAREGPLSLLTEDAGWRHLGPGPAGRVVELDGFDHGGPSVSIDPIDGTRNLMAGLRSAWSVVSLAPPLPRQPRMSDQTLALVSEIPLPGAARRLTLLASKGAGCRISSEAEGATPTPESLIADSEARVDHGYFPFFRYAHVQRPALARIEASFFGKLATEEGADLRYVWDDQYISNGGQLVLLARGTYRVIADLRAWLGPAGDPSITTSKPYDLAGAVLCAREAGCEVTDASGADLDFPIDAKTPISFVGYANRGTRERVERHLLAALDAR